MNEALLNSIEYHSASRLAKSLKPPTGDFIDEINYRHY